MSLEDYVQHRPDCTIYRCGNCALSRSSGHHEDSYNGDTTWHAFEKQDCTCGLDRALAESRARPTRAQVEVLLTNLSTIGEYKRGYREALEAVLALFPPQEPT